MPARRTADPDRANDLVAHLHRHAAAEQQKARDVDEVRWAKRVIDEMGDGTGTVMIDGKMQDDATVKQCKVVVELAKMLAARDPQLTELYGL